MAEEIIGAEYPGTKKNEGEKNQTKPNNERGTRGSVVWYD